MPSGRKKDSKKQRLPNNHRYAATIPFGGLSENLSFLCSNNLDVEVMMYDTAWVRNFPYDEVEAMGNLLEKKGIGVSVHGPLFDLNPGSQDRIIRDYTKFNFMRTLNISSLLKARIVVFHLGFNPLIPSQYRKNWLRASLKTFKPVVNHAKRLGIVIAIENMFISSPHLLRQVIEAVDSPNMRVCLDIGHVNVYSAVPLAEWMEVLGKHIVKIHINDNDAENDLHLAFGEGNVDFKEVYRLLLDGKIDAQMTLEMSPGKLSKTLKYIRYHELSL